MTSDNPKTLIEVFASELKSGEAVGCTDLLGSPTRILSLGAGVQSTTMALMSLCGELPPVKDWIFADTQDEPAEVYRHLDKLEVEASKFGVTLHRVTIGKLSEAVIKGIKTKKVGAKHEYRHIAIPTYTTGGSVRWRHCTKTYKISPVIKRAKLIADGNRIEMMIGISLDEAHRMKDAQQKQITNTYPLVDMRLTRRDCEKWLKENGWKASKSACIYCPYHDKAGWQAIKSVKSEWETVVAMDRELNKRGEYLHRSLKPIDEVNLLTDEELGQASLFGNECEGMCGV